MTEIRGSGGGGGGCFAGETLVSIPGGQCRIDEIKAGQSVLSFDDKGDVYPCEVLKVHKHSDEEVSRYLLWGGDYVDATPNHWVLNQYNAFVEIGSLGQDDCVVDSLNHLRPIVSKKPLGKKDVYNLTVEERHTFIANNVRVHNAGLGARIAGAGGGGGGGGKGGGGGSSKQRTPERDRDNLASTQYATVVDLISEGEIQGIYPNLTQGSFIDGVPLYNEFGGPNFSGLGVDFRSGTQSQPAFAGISGTESEIPVNAPLFTDAGQQLVERIEDVEVDAVRITLSVPNLSRIEQDGDQRGAKVHVQVYVRPFGGGYVLAVNDIISGRTLDLYQRDYIVGTPNATIYDILVRRISESGEIIAVGNQFSSYVNDFIWTSFTEIKYARLRYPNSALVKISIDASQFRSIPARSYRVRGIKVRIPSNATVDQNNGRVIYSGVWNGQLGAAQWCTDPSWILYDLLTSTRYGFGGQVKESQLDKAAFYSASVYASGLVPTGFGGFEPRFSCNINIQAKQEAFSLIGEMCSIFRAMPYWSQGALTISNDQPRSASYIFTAANVTPDGFSYEGSSQKNRPNVVVVAYQDLAAQDLAYESVEDAEQIAKFGVIKKEIKAVACTSRGQAHRLGEWLLYTERYEAEVIKFSTSIEAGILVRPGQVIAVDDPVRSGQRRGGRIVSATASQITVESVEHLTAANSGSLTVVMPDGTIETKTITSISGTVVTLTSPLSAIPNANAPWIYQSANIVSSIWRVISITEEEGIKYNIAALAYNASKFNFIERGVPLTFRDITDLNIIYDAPSDLSFKEVLFESDGKARSKLIISWSNVKGVTVYRVRWRIEDGNWETRETTTNEYEILDSVKGTYQFEVVSLNRALIPSPQPGSLVISAFGRTAKPSDVEDLQFSVISSTSARLTWSPTIDLDVKLGGKVRIRHSSKTDGTGTWAGSQDLITAIAGHSTDAVVPLLEGEYLVKFEDILGFQSLSAQSVVNDRPNPLAPFSVLIDREDSDIPPFSGQNVDGVFYYENAFTALVMGGVGLFDTIDDLDSVADLINFGGLGTSAIYNFAEQFDLEGIYEIELARHLVAQGYFTSDLIDQRVGNVDSYEVWDGASADGSNSKVEVRFTSQDPAATPTWSEWQSLTNASYRARAFEFRLNASVPEGTGERFLCEELGFKGEMNRRSENALLPIQSGAGTKAVTFESAFWSGTARFGGVNSQLPSIGITAQNFDAGDYFQVTNVTGSGFSVTFYDSSNTPVDKTFSYQALGYGKRA